MKYETMIEELERQNKEHMKLIERNNKKIKKLTTQNTPLKQGVKLRRRWSGDDFSEYLIISVGENEGRYALLDLEHYDFHVDEVYESLVELHNYIKYSSSTWEVVE